MYKRQNQVLLLLMVAFFLSGGAALIYQVLWLRKLILTFGSTTIAVSTILACFMGGLALGSYLMANRAFNVKKVLFIYAFLEFFVAIYAFILPNIFDLTDYLYLNIWPYINHSGALLVFTRFILVTSALIFPTTMMGATLPLIVKYFINKNEYIIKYISVLYAINTFGAVIGSFLAGFVFIEHFGLYKTNLIAVSLNILAGLIALFMEKRDTRSDHLTKNIADLKVEKPLISFFFNEKVILWAMLFSGFTSMAYEIVWTRQLVLVFGSTTYSYTCILVVFLIGIAFGSYSVRKSFEDSSKNMLYFGICQALLAILIVAGTFYYPNLFYGYYLISLTLPAELFSLAMLLVSALLIFPVAAIYGILFPLSVRILTKDYQFISEKTGYVYAFNTVGCILGSLCCGFIMIPFLGLKNSLIFGSIINILIALSVLNCYFRSYRKRVTIFVAVFMIIAFFLFAKADWQKTLLSSGMAINNSRFKSVKMDDLYKELNKKEVLYYVEGYHSTIGVMKTFFNTRNNQQSSVISLYNNGKIDASTLDMDMRTQTALAFFPAFLAPKIDDVLIVGYGSGITVALMEKFKVKNLEVVELEKEIVDTTSYFSDLYGNPLNDKRLNLIIGDARDYLRVTDKKYDVIISEPSNLWINGVANLFTQEYYHSIKSKLKKNGILFQWMQVYLLDEQSVKSVLKALHNEFQYVYVFDNRTKGDITLVASEKPVKFDFQLIQNRISDPFLIGELKRLFGVESPLDVLNMCISNSSNLEKYIQNTIPNTDDNSILMYRATRSYFNLRGNDSLKRKPETEVLKFNLVNFYKLMKGINVRDVINGPENIFELLANRVLSQTLSQENSLSQVSLDNKDMYKQVMLNYARKAYKKDPDKLSAVELLAIVSIETNNVDLALKYLEKSAKLGTKNPIIYYYLALIYSKNYESGKRYFNPQKARGYVTALQSLKPNNIDSLYFLAESYYYEDNFLMAKKYYDNYFKAVQKYNLSPLKNFDKHYQITLNALSGTIGKP